MSNERQRLYENSGPWEKDVPADLIPAIKHLRKSFEDAHWGCGQTSQVFCYSLLHNETVDDPAKEYLNYLMHMKARVPTLEQIKHVIQTMPTKTEIERRNRALIAFTLLTGARDSAIASMKLKHVDVVGRCVHQDARDVKTKFSKTFSTYFFPVGDETFRIIEAWVFYLREEKLWGNDDPLFPMTRIALGMNRQFEVSGLDPAHWSSASPVRSIFRDAFVGAGLPYFNPHSFRNTLVRLGQDLCKSPEEFKAWGQNLGHEKVLTTFLSYGAVASDRQGEILRGLTTPQQASKPDANELLEALFVRLRDAGVNMEGRGY
jgi:integrase